MNIYLSYAVAVMLSFAITALLGFILIPKLRALKFGQTILEIGPSWHKKKQGTPTMGGIMFIVGTVVSLGCVFFLDYFTGKNIIPKGDTFAFNADNVKLWAGIGMAVMLAAVGFIDDYIIVIKKQNLGLNIRQKTFLQTLIIIAYISALYNVGAEYTYIPFLGRVNFSWFYFVFAFVIIYATVNAVNFTDGIDGLCASVTAVAGVGFLIIAILMKYTGMGLLAACLIGGCVGFLIWNWNPAKIMMGDVGSLFLGGLVIALAFGLDVPIILVPVGIIYIIEGASVVIQMAYFKLTGGKRLFKMTPIHHHFEIIGWSEKKIVAVFSLVGLVGGIVAILLVYFGITITA